MGSRGGSSKTRVSDYYLATHVGVCHGPVEAVLEIKVGEKVAWSGSSSPADGSAVDGHNVKISNEGLFGGNKKEGGVAGTMTVLHGAATQLIPSKIAQFIGLARDKAPGYRGILSLFFHSADGRQGFKWASNNPYLKPLWVKVRSKPGTWYPQKAMIGGDANPMHIIRECLVNTDWGMGAATKFLDDAQMRQVADTLYSEGFGLSLMWAQQASIESFIAEILRHVNGTMCINPSTGKFHFKLIREDYIQATLTAFNRNQGTIRSSQRKGWDETVNEINVSWTNPESEESEVVTVHDPANITIQGAIVADSRDMYGIRNIDLATRVAMREIQAASKPLMQVDVDFDRSAFGLLPGDAIKLVDWKELNFSEIVMRVVTIDYGTPDSMVIRASLVEDVFGQPAVYTAQNPDRWQSSAEDPKPIVSWEVMTAPYFMVARLLGETRAQSLTYPAVYPLVMAAPEGGDTNTYVQQAQRGNIAGTGPVWQNSYDRVPVGFATLVNILPIGVTGEVTLTGLKGRVYAEVGNYLFIGGQNGEICLITDTSSGAIVVRRGCLDTSPRQWPAGTPVWITDDNRHGFDEELSAYGATQNYRLLPTTSKGQLQASLAPVISGTMSDRPFRPYPPANVRVNGDLFPSAKQLPLAFSWSERNRILETSVILPWDSGSVPAEPGTSYTLEVDAFVGGAWQVNAVVVRNAVITSFEVKADILPSNTTAIRFRLWATKGGLRSWTNVEHTFAIGDSGTGLPPGAVVEFGPPPAPVSVLVNARRNSIVLTPQFASVDTFACEFWRARTPLKYAEIETEAFKAGQGVFIEDTGLAIDTAYFYFIRAVNTYGKSDWYTVEARTKIDPQQILDEMDGLIDSSKLTPVLQEDLGKLPALEIEFGKIPAIEQEIGKIPAIEQEIGKIPAIEQKVGKIPAIEQEVGKIPGIEQEVGKIPSIEQSIDLVDTKAEHAALGVLSVAAAQTKSEERRLVSEASIKDSQVVLADEQQALASRIETLDAGFTTGLSEANAAIQNESTVRATADAAQAQQISALDTKFTTGLSDASAAVQQEAVARADADSAQVQQINALDTKFTTDIASANAAIQQEATARSTADAAQVQATQALDTKFTTDLASANAAIQQEATARSAADASLAQQIDALDTEFTTDIASANAAIQAEATARSSADAAQVQATQALDTKFTTDLASANAAIQQEVAARSTADAAQVQATQALDTKFTTDLASANAAIQNEATARSTADASLAQQISALDTAFTTDLADVNAAIQQEATARSTADAAQVQATQALDTKFTTDLASANAAIQSEAAARATADSAQASVSEGLKAELVKSGEAALSNAVKDFEGEQRQRTVSAEIKEDLNVVVNDQVAMAERIETLTSNFESDIAITNASVSELARVTSTADSALAEQIAQVSAEVDTATASLAASIQEEATARADADAAQAQATQALDTKFATGLSEANAAIQNEATARSTADAAQVQQINALDTKFTTDIASANAAIQSEAAARSTADAAQASVSEGLKAELVKSGEASLSNAIKDFDGEIRQLTSSAEIKTDLNVVVDDQKALAQRIETVQASFETGLSAAEASIVQEALTRADADSAQAQLINSLDTKFTTDIGEANSAIQQEAIARADADSAQVQATQALDTKFTTDIASANAAIQSEAAARSSADSAQAQQISALDTKFTTDIASANAAIQSEAAARSTADSALSQSISTVQSSLNGTMATVQQNSQAIVSLEGGAQAMWTTKAQAGDITAGIGLIADQATGKSQVMVNASQFFVFDNAVGKTAIFAIDQGQVIIRDAVIRKATIDILNATQITATNVKAGQAGFGAGGGYPMFGSSWFTTIDSTGTIRTNKLQAAGGNISNMSIGSCVISEDCDVRGTLYAGRIVGDLYRKKEFTLPAKGLTGPFNPWVEVPILSATISASPFQQRIILENIASSFKSAGVGTNVTGYLRARLNGVVYDIASKNMGSDTSIFRLAGPFSATVPANAIGTLDVFITASQTFYFNRNEVIFGALECFKAESSVLVVNVA